MHKHGERVSLSEHYGIFCDSSKLTHTIETGNCRDNGMVPGTSFAMLVGKLQLLSKVRIKKVKVKSERPLTGMRDASHTSRVVSGRAWSPLWLTLSPWLLVTSPPH